LPFNDITIAYIDNEYNWWFADSYFKRTGNFTSFQQNYLDEMQPFVVNWNEVENQWTYYTPNETNLVRHSDVNAILRIGNSVYFGTMYGLIYIDLYNRNWDLIDTKKGLNDDAVWDIEVNSFSIYVATAKGVNEISIIDHTVIIDKANIFNSLRPYNIYDIEVDTNSIYFATSDGLKKKDWLGESIIDISDKEFNKIKLYENGIYGTDGSLWLIDEEYQEKFIESNIQNFDICNSFIWSIKNGNVGLLDYTTNERWEYDQADGILGEVLYGINCDKEWVWFLTNKGLSFYNWDKFHNEK